MLPPMEQLLPQLPPSLCSLSITQFSITPHGPPAPQPAPQRTYASWAASGLKMLQQRAQLERLLAMEVSLEGAEAPWVQTQLLPALTHLHLSGMDLTCGPTWQWLSSLEHLEVGGCGRIGACGVHLVFGWGMWCTQCYTWPVIMRLPLMEARAGQRSAP